MSTIGIDVTQVTVSSDVPLFKLGTKGCLQTDDGTKEYVYVELSEAVTFVGQVLQMWGVNNQALLADDGSGAVGRGARIGVAPVIAANGAFIWMQVYGRATVATLASFAAGAKPYVTASPGYVDDAATAGLESIEGMYCGTATGGAAAANTSFTLNYPSIGVTA